MSTKTDDITGRLKAVLLEAKAIADTCEADGDRDFTDDERTIVMAKMKEAGGLRAELEQAKGDAATRKAINELGDGIQLNETKSGDLRTPSGLIVPRKSLGAEYVESAEFKTLLASAPNGRFGKDQRIQAHPTGFSTLLGGRKALVTGSSDTSAGAFVTNDYRGLQQGLDLFQRPLKLRDLVTPGTTDSDTVEYVRITGATNNAAPVAEAASSATPTAPGGAGALIPAANGGYKPESGLSTAKITAIVKTIAHWIPVTKRALSDAAQMKTLIDNFLEYGLEEELEDQMVTGNNTGENFEGLNSVSGYQSQAFATDLLATYRKAKTKVRTIGRSVPNAYLINPADVETLDLLKDGESRFYSGGPFGNLGATQLLWNVPIIETEAVTAGTAWLGDFRKAILWDREQSSITTTDSHADFFVRNLVAVLAEMRAAFGVIQPSAFVKIALA